MTPVTAPVAGSAFPTRRELRAQREAEARASAVPAESSAPAASAESVAAAEPVVSTEPVASTASFDRARRERTEAIPAIPTPAEIAATPIVPVDQLADLFPTATAVESVQVVAAPTTASAGRARRDVATASARPKRQRPAAAPKPVVDRSKARSIRQRITVTGTMVIVGGIFASLTLPAYAFSEQNKTAAPVTETSTQSLAVDAGTADAAVTRDSYGATSAADLRGLYTNALKQKNLSSYLSSGAKALGDDYPWPGDLTRSEGGGLSPLRYYYRECVDFVAWRLNRDAGSTTAPYRWDWSTLTPGNGNASGWKSAWAAHGWASGSTPQVGAVAWFPYNHVAYVNGVLADGSVVLEEYNYGSDHLYDQRIVKASDVALFLYAPPR